MLKGEFMLNGFIAIKPESEVAKQLELLAHLDDAEHVARYRAFEDWFKHTQDIPGAFYLWIVEHLFRDNELVRGRRSRSAASAWTSRRIRRPLFLLGGRARPHHAAARRSSRSPTTSRTPAGGRRRSASRAAATSASSWAARRCATTGRRSWPRSTSARGGAGVGSPLAARNPS